MQLTGRGFCLSTQACCGCGSWSNKQHSDGSGVMTKTIGAQTDDEKRRIEMRYYCTDCDLALRVVPCFEHTKRNVYNRQTY